MERLSLVVIITLGLLLMAVSAFAATATQDLTISATVAAGGKIEFSSAISFPNTDPDITSSIPSTPASETFTIKAKTGKTSVVTLTVKTDGDLISGSDPIPISNVTWTASGSGFVAGTMSKTTDQLAGSWIGSGNRSGSFFYFLANSWSYATGNYTAIATYTLTIP